MIHRHRKQIAILKMIENAKLKIENYIKMINSGLNLKENLKKAETTIAIQERLINYYYSI